MELKLTATKERKDGRLEVYEISEYEVRVATYKDGYYSINVKNNGGRFTPDIYCNTSFDDDSIIGFDVQTTSYGSLSIEEIIEVADKLKAAAEVAKILVQKFVR